MSLPGRKNLSRPAREQYDIATSRAVARLNILAELCLPYVKVGGAFLAMKGALAGEEMEEAKRAVALLGGMIEQVYEYPIQDALHKAVVIRKIRPTPTKYPRAFAENQKKSVVGRPLPGRKERAGWIFSPCAGGWSCCFSACLRLLQPQRAA